MVSGTDVVVVHAGKLLEVEGGEDAEIIEERQIKLRWVPDGVILLGGL